MNSVSEFWKYIFVIKIWKYMLRLEFLNTLVINDMVCQCGDDTSQNYKCAFIALNIDDTFQQVCNPLFKFLDLIDISW